MIITQLKGGLGNQLFQYAAGRSLSIRYKSPLKLDLSFLEANKGRHTKRFYELNKLHVQAEIATEEEIRFIKKLRLRKPFHTIRIKDKGIAHFSKKIKHTAEHLFLDGFWQSEQYFKSISDTIRNEFRFKEPLQSDYFLQIIRQIENSESVSLHFRRGDYVQDSKTNQYHGVCPISYYLKAVHLITANLRNPLLFIFSDDIHWVQSNFKCDFPMVFIEHSNEKLHSDFRLMSMCKHNIIANSSYSWWAAWLNNNAQKTIIAPHKWFEDKRSQQKASEIIPKEWITV